MHLSEIWHSKKNDSRLSRTQVVRAKALKLQPIHKAFALTGRQVCVHDNPGRCPGLRASALSGRAAYRKLSLRPMTIE